MEFSQCFNSSQHLRSSPNGAYVATIISSQLVIRSTFTLEVIRTIDLKSDFASRVSSLRWSTQRDLPGAGPGHPSNASRPSNDLQGFKKPGRGGEFTLKEVDKLRILVTDGDSIKVWDLQDAKWTATISAAGGGIGIAARIDFGRDENEILVFSESGVRLTVWFLNTSRSIEIRDPKFATRGYGYRPRTGHLALLTRPGPHDLMSLHAPGTYKILRSIALPTTDAQSLKWSPCGRWIAICDSASSGYKVLVYTANGNLFKTYLGEEADDSRGLGVKDLEWSPSGDHLAVGGFNERVTLLSNITFIPVVFLEHTTTIRLPKINTWQERVSGSGERVYTIAGQPMCPPYVTSLPTETSPKIGVSTIAFDSSDRRLLATRNDSMPTTVWIWSLENLAPLAIIVQHSPIKDVAWHPTIGGLLLIHCVREEGVIFLWNARWAEPRVVKLPMDKLTGKYEARWISKTEDPGSSKSDFPSHHNLDDRARIIVGDGQHYLLGYIGEREQPESNAPGADEITEVSLENTSSRAPAATGGKKQKKKWSKGKVKDKANHAVILDKSTSDKLYKDVQSYRLITVATLVDRLKINGSLARKALNDLEEKGQIKKVVGHHSLSIYTRAVTAAE
ncbi:MAG: hypothetical protein M1827_001056 [Pycnora praestabilis]|nr:MAG: hypothetical protein M1827_001056 [Pycnora praestabilis]